MTLLIYVLCSNVFKLNYACLSHIYKVVCVPLTCNCLLCMYSRLLLGQSGRDRENMFILSEVHLNRSDLKTQSVLLLVHPGTSIGFVCYKGLHYALLSYWVIVACWHYENLCAVTKSNISPSLLKSSSVLLPMLKKMHRRIQGNIICIMCEYCRAVPSPQ